MQQIERETYINFNDAEDTAVLCTFNRAWLSKMDKLAAKSREFTVRVRKDGYGEYLFPKKLVTVRMPRIMGEKQRKQAQQRAITNFGYRALGVDPEEIADDE